MPRQPWPEWIVPAIDGRFNDLATLAGNLDEIQPLRIMQSEIELRLKQELSTNQYALILEWEE